MKNNEKPKVLVPAIAMPQWLAEFEAANLGRAVPGDAEKVRFTVGIAVGNVRHGTGGPFAAAVFELGTDRLIAVGINSVVPAGQSWAHAEMTAFARAQFKLGTVALENCALASSCEPCAMCNGATLWSGVRKLIYGATREMAESIGFDEGYKGPAWREEFAARGIEVVGPLLGDEAFEPFMLYRKNSGKIY